MSESLKEHLLLTDIRRRADEHFDRPEPVFRISHEGLLQRARQSPPADSNRRAIVSAFSDWVYDLYYHPFGRSPNVLWNLRQEESFRRLAALELGTAAEPAMVEKYIRELKEQAAQRHAQREVERKQYMARYAERTYKGAGWEIIYNGTSASDEQSKLIDHLRINADPLKAKPDLVLRDSESGDVLVLELKTWRGGKYLPRFGWANTKAQLWCYGLLQWPEQPRNVYLQVHVWLRQRGELTGRFWVLTPWRSNDPRIHREALQLFEAFGGTYIN